MQPKNKGKGNLDSGGPGRRDKMRWSETEFPGGPAVTAPHLHCQDLDWIPGQETKTLHVMWFGPKKEDDTREPTQALRPTGHHSPWPLYETQNLIFSMRVHENVKE